MKRRSIPRHLRRRTETLIPVTLRLLDETGRHRIAEPMLGIAVEISGDDLKVSVMGRAGRPLSHGLAAQQKVLVSFLATELHAKVESLVCELRSVSAIAGQPDAWRVRLMLPALMPELAEEIISALQRYGRYPKRTVSWWTAGGMAVALGVGAWLVTSYDAEREIRAREGVAQRLRAQLAFSTTTVDRLATSLEEADAELEKQRGELSQAEEDRLSLAVLRDENTTLRRRVERAESQPGPRMPPRVQMRGVSLTDFHTVRSIRGDAPAPRLAYEDGTLELMGTAPEQQRIARMVGRLLGAYALVESVDLRSFGTWSLESSDGQVGLETEEAFVVGGEKADRPDFVFETRDVDSGGWLSAYAKLGVREVWTYRDGRLEIRSLTDGGYTIVPRSTLLPELDPAILSQYVVREDQSAAVRDFARGFAGSDE